MRKEVLILAVASVMAAVAIWNTAIWAELVPAPAGPSSGMSQFGNWDAVKAAQAKDAEILMRAVELYCPQPRTALIEAYVCPEACTEQKIEALKRSKKELRIKTFSVDDPVIVAIDDRIEDLGGNE